jgi:hypothetical protein
MEQIDFTTYKLDNRGINNISYLLYNYLDNYAFVECIIKHFSIELLIKTKNNGLISNILLYHIKILDNEIINKLLIMITELDNFKLMKRDYLNLIYYYYNNNYEQAKVLFKQNILPEGNLQLKDIEFILENNLIKLLPYLDNLFIELPYLDNLFNIFSLVNPQILKLNKVNIKQNCILSLLKKIELEFSINLINNINNFYTNLKNNFKVIIDAGNILFGRNGIITKNSLIDLENIIIKTKNTIGEPLIIIHQRHFKNNKIIDIFLRTNTTYYKTIYNLNDDLFILWFFLKSNCATYIISNDKYRDHIFKYKSLSNKNEFSICEFKNIIKQQTLEFNLITMEIQQILPWSLCIQYIDSVVYIPHISGNFISVNIH